MYNRIVKEGLCMNLFELMDTKKSSFSKTDRLIFERIQKFPNSFANESITSICEKAGFTKSALTRFAQKLGFSGFTEFQYQFQQDIKENKNDPQHESNAAIYGKILKNVEESTDPGIIRELTGRMKNSHAVYLYGSNLSRLPAEQMLVTLSFEKEITPIMPAQDFTPYHYREDDMIIIYSSISGSSHQNLLKELRQEDKTVPYRVLITVNAKHPLRHNFEQVIVLPTASMSESQSETIHSDTFAYMMFNDMVGSALSEDKQ